MTQKEVQAGNGARYGHLGTTEKHDVRKTTVLLQLRAKQARREWVAKLDQVGSHLRRKR